MYGNGLDGILWVIIFLAVLFGAALCVFLFFVAPWFWDFVKPIINSATS